MATISSITLPNGSTYEIGSGNAEFIYGTQTAQTGSCLGTTTDTELTDGKEILYFFPYGTSGEVTLNLTLAGGGSTGAINCYKTGLVRMKAFYQYETVRLTYHRSLKIGSSYYEGWWADGDKDKDGQELALSRSPYTASAAFYQYVMLFTKDSTTLMPSTSANNDQTTGKTLSTDSFNPFGPIYRYNDTTAVASGGTIPDEKLSTQQAFDLRRSFNIRVDLIANKAVYLKCNPVSGSRRKAQFVTSFWGTNDPITQDLPSTEDGYYYVYLGQAYSTYTLQMTAQHPVYMFKDGECREVSQFAEVADKAIQDGAGNNIASTYVPYKGSFTGDINATDIEPGIYNIDAFSITVNGSAAAYYGTFIQYPGTYKPQFVIGNQAGSAYSDGGLLTRRYLTGSSAWSDWYYALEPSLPLTGGEISGQVRMTSNEVAPLRIKHSFPVGTNPSAIEYRSIYFTDNSTSSTNTLASLSTRVDTNGSSYVDILAANNLASGSTNTGFRISQSYNGTGNVQARIAGTDYDLWHKGNFAQAAYTPTKSSSLTSLTVNRAQFYRMGPIVLLQINMTNSAQITSNTTLFTGFPKPAATVDVPLLQTGSTANRSVYVDTSGNLKVSGTMAAATWVVNGWYYTTAT